MAAEPDLRADPARDGLVRVEVHVAAEGADLVRNAAAALRDPA